MDLGWSGARHETIIRKYDRPENFPQLGESHGKFARSLVDPQGSPEFTARVPGVVHPGERVS